MKPIGCAFFVLCGVLCFCLECGFAAEQTRENDVARRVIQDFVDSGELPVAKGLGAMVVVEEIIAVEGDSAFDELAFNNKFDELHRELGNEVYYFRSLALIHAMKADIDGERGEAFFKRANIKVLTDMQMYIVSRLEKTGPDAEKIARALLNRSLERLAHERTQIQGILAR